MNRLRFWIIAVPLLLAGMVASLEARAADDAYVVVVHPDVIVKTLSVRELGRIYKKVVTEWPDRSRISPVELGGTSPVRKQFYQDTMNIMVGDVATYWINQAMTTGIKPPRVFPSNELVLKYVARTPGAIGFVTREAILTGTVKRVTIR